MAICGLAAAALVLWGAAPLAVQPAAQSAAAKRVSLIVTNGIVVTVDGERRVLNPGAVAIDGSDIAGVDTPDAIKKQFSAAQTIDAGGQGIMPGLINTHTHA